MNTPFTNEQIDIDQLPTFESVHLTKPSSKYWWVILINILMFLLASGLILAACILLDDSLQINLPLVIGLFVVFSALLILIYRASFTKRGFALRDKDIIFKSGIIAETTTVVPLNRIQHVALDEGVFSRMFRLGKLQIFTAGGHSGHVMIAGIDIDLAKQMKDSLLSKLNRLAKIENEPGL